MESRVVDPTNRIISKIARLRWAIRNHFFHEWTSLEILTTPSTSKMTAQDARYGFTSHGSFCNKRHPPRNCLLSHRKSKSSWIIICCFHYTGIRWGGNTSRRDRQSGNYPNEYFPAAHTHSSTTHQFIFLHDWRFFPTGPPQPTEQEFLFLRWSRWDSEEWLL